jgi:dsDNA-specific endonuclease/ATPase MutS2
MQPGALKSLEFDRIVEAVKTFALTPMGSERLGRLEPSTDPQTVADLIAHTTETARFLAANGALPLRATADLPDILAALGVEGRPLEALRLLALATFLESVDETRTAIRRAPRSSSRWPGSSGRP